jgi:hypothetical protein
MPSAGSKPAIPAGERLQTHALDRSATGIGIKVTYAVLILTHFSIYYLKVHKNGPEGPKQEAKLL